MSIAVADIRNVALIGPSGTGKTTIVDALALKMGLVNRMGSVDQGTSLSDHEAEELDRKHSFRAALIQGSYKKKSINLVDCPGYPDFISEAISALAAVETAALVISSTDKITFTTRTLWKHAQAAGVARVILVTRNESENTDFEELVGLIQEAFGDRCVPLAFPDANGSSFQGVVSILKKSDAPAGLKDRAETYYSTLVERVVEADEALMETYLEEGAISDDVLLANLPKALAGGTVVPILAVEPKSGSGVQELLDFIADHAPSPADAKPAEAAQGDKTLSVSPDPNGPVLAQVWKIVSDQHVGRITFLKLHSGTITGDSALYGPESNKPSKLNGINTFVGREGLKPLDKAIAGDLVAIAKVEEFDYGETIGSEPHGPQFPSISQPKPMTSLAVRPRSQGDEQRLGEGLRRLSVEDPTFVMRREEATGELLIEGMSDLHLQILLERLKRRSKVEVDTTLPKIPYKETVAARAEGHHRHKKQTGGRGQFGECYIRIGPRPRGEGFEFVDKIVGGSIPRNLIPAVEKGVREAMKKGPLAGCEVVDFEVELYDGKFHAVDSDEASFKMAGSRAFRDGFLKARPILLEPIMEIEIHVPSRFMGDITGDVNSRRGRIQGMDVVGDLQIIKARIPLSEVQSYSTELRSITAGEGSFSMEFAGFEQVPPHIQEKIVAAYQKPAEED